MRKLNECVRISKVTAIRAVRMGGVMGRKMIIWEMLILILKTTMLVFELKVKELMTRTKIKIKIKTRIRIKIKIKVKLKLRI